MKDAAEELIGVAMADLRVEVRAHARSDSPVLIFGEHGTGKRIAARALHDSSKRAAAPFVGLDCDVCTAKLFETELCGWEAPNRPGRIEQASGGTLYVWHVSELEPISQRFLLRLIKDRTFERIGSARQRSAKVRVVASTCRPLPEVVSRGEFLVELADCFEALQLVLPPLRERMCDFGLLVNRYLALYELTISQAALEHLATMTWYENVSDVEDFLAPIAMRSSAGAQLDVDTIRSEPPLEPPVRLARAQRAARDRALAEDAMRKAGGDSAAAAESLGVGRSRLFWMLRAAADGGRGRPCFVTRAGSDAE